MIDVIQATPSSAGASEQPSVSSSQESPKAESPKAPAAKEKIKVDKVEEEYSIDELKKFAQLGRAKEKRFEESAKIRKEAEAKLERLKSSPWDVLKELGLDPRKLSEEFLGEVVKEELLSPEEREKLQLKRELDKYKKKDEEERSKQEQAQFEAEKQKHIEKFDQELSSALSSTSLPKSPGVIRRVAKYLHDALADGEDMSVEEAVSLVEQDYLDEVQEFFGSAKNPSKYLPKDLAKQLMESHLSQVKAAPKYSQDGEGSQPKAEPKVKTLSSNDYMKKILGQ